MSNEQKSDTTKTKADVKTPQSQMDKETKQGFRGVEVDSTPNWNYSVAGVTSNAPTPETDVEQAKIARNDTGLGLSALEWQTNEKAKEAK